MKHYSEDISSVLLETKSSAEGLTSQEADKRLAEGGKNKLAEDYDKALWRARNIAAPKNAFRLKTKTPCAEMGDQCYDCKSPARICRALSVLWCAPTGSQYEVVLVKEDLGY